MRSAAWLLLGSGCVTHLCVQEFHSAYCWSDDQQQHGGSSFSQFIVVFFVILCGHCDLLTPSFLGHEGHEALHKEHHEIIIVVGDALLNTNEGENFYCGPAAWLR